MASTCSRDPRPIPGHGLNPGTFRIETDFSAALGRLQRKPHRHRACTTLPRPPIIVFVQDAPARPDEDGVPVLRWRAEDIVDFPGDNALR